VKHGDFLSNARPAAGNIMWDDKLAGKTVKCKGWGAAINVPMPQSDLPPVPDIFGLDASEAHELSAGGKSPVCHQKVPSCGAPSRGGSRICLGCGLIC